MNCFSQKKKLVKKLDKLGRKRHEQTAQKVDSTPVLAEEKHPCFKSLFQTVLNHCFKQD